MYTSRPALRIGPREGLKICDSIFNVYKFQNLIRYKRNGSARAKGGRKFWEKLYFFYHQKLHFQKNFSNLCNLSDLSAVFSSLRWVLTSLPLPSRSGLYISMIQNFFRNRKNVKFFFSNFCQLFVQFSIIFNKFPKKGNILKISVLFFTLKTSFLVNKS